MKGMHKHAATMDSVLGRQRVGVGGKYEKSSKIIPKTLVDKQRR